MPPTNPRSRYGPGNAVGSGNVEGRAATRDAMFSAEMAKRLQGGRKLGGAVAVLLPLMPLYTPTSSVLTNQGAHPYALGDVRAIVPEDKLEKEVVNWATDHTCGALWGYNATKLAALKTLVSMVGGVEKLRNALKEFPPVPSAANYMGVYAMTMGVDATSGNEMRLDGTQMVSVQQSHTISVPNTIGADASACTGALTIALSTKEGMSDMVGQRIFTSDASRGNVWILFKSHNAVSAKIMEAVQRKHKSEGKMSDKDILFEMLTAQQAIDILYPKVATLANSAIGGNKVEIILHGTGY